MGGNQSRKYRPEPFDPNKTSNSHDYEAWRASRADPYMKLVKKNYRFYVRAAFARRDDL